MIDPRYAVVFAGGGCRTVWGLGVLDALELPPPVELAGVSAGSAMALIAATGRTDAARAAFVEEVERNPRNIYVSRMLRRGAVFPHEQIYRATLASALNDGGLDALQTAPPVRVLLASVPTGRRGLAAVARGLRDYRRRKRAGQLHGPDATGPGIREEVATLHHEHAPDAIADHILASSATWPVTSLPRRNGRVYVDACIIDGVPVRALSPAARRLPTLVLLSRPAPAGVPEVDGRLYLAPDAPLPVKKWDYTRADLLLATYALGQAHGRAARGRLQDWLRV